VDRPRRSVRLATWVALAVAIVGLAGCAEPSAPNATITREDATLTAMRSTTSSTPVSVTSTRLSTYGHEAAGGSVAPADTPVWAVEVAGTFELSCGPAPAPSVTKVCPPPLTSELILIDARTGVFIQGIGPAPARN
jgi:hypothetical protein